ncbi:MAG: HDOD domain-containing protein [Pseudomonadota bacterium]
MPVVLSDSIDSLTKNSAPSGVAPTISTSVSAERISQQVEALGPLPAVALEVMQLTEDPESDARDLQQTISRDAVIAGKVLKMANSAFFSSGQPCQTLQQASARLGMKMIRNLVVSSCVAGMMEQQLERYPYVPFGLQRHSLTLALLTGEVITRLELPRVLIDELFLDGLLHDIGKLVLNPLLPSEIAHTGRQGVADERTRTGTDHATIGVLMAQHWKLPEHTVAVIGHHHDCANAPEEFRSHAAVVEVTDWILNRRAVGLDPDAPVEEAVDSQALSTLCIDSDTLSQLAVEAEDAIEQILELCDNIL